MERHSSGAVMLRSLRTRGLYGELVATILGRDKGNEVQKHAGKGLGSFVWLVTRIFLGKGQGFNPLPAWYGALVSLARIAQFFVPVTINRKYDRTVWRRLFWIRRYPLAFFAVGALAAVRTAYRGLFGELEDAGLWEGPSRLHIVHQEIKERDSIVSEI